MSTKMMHKDNNIQLHVSLKHITTYEKYETFIIYINVPGYF